MESKHMTLRLDDTLIQRLDQWSRKTGQTRSELARTLLDEGLRMASHPGIVFRPGPAGRRAALGDGPDVWEIMSVYRQLNPEEGDLAEQTADQMGLSPFQVRTALHYYADFRNEIDDWIDRNDKEAEAAYEAWLREQQLLRR